MRSSNSQKPSDTDRRLISESRLMRQMSEVISLREKVAQAELAVLRYGVSIQDGNEGTGNKRSID
jgi:hypothetical protein